MKKIIITIFAIALSLGVFAQQNDTMFVHSGQTIFHISTAEVDSIVFYPTGTSVPMGTVIRDTIFATLGVTLSQNSAVLLEGAELTLIATVLPENATNRNVTWSSSNPAVATVANGIVTAVSLGEATITATTEDGGHTATSEITVSLTPTIPVTDVTLSRASTTLVAGAEFTLTATVLPANADNKTVTWTSSNPDIATVVNGIVTAVAVGVARIIATTEDGNHTATSPVSVITTQRGCNTNPPNWGGSLGTVSFHPQGHNVVIEGYGITQTWSGAVIATNCQKGTFNGGFIDWNNPNNSNFNADCRSNPDFPGDLFSWCAVVRFADQLCPYPWRVPTQQDFITLDIAMGGTGGLQTDLDFVNSNYITRWGGAFGGRVDTSLNSNGWSGEYWAQSEESVGTGRRLYFTAGGFIIPWDRDNKDLGFSLRCVR